MENSSSSSSSGEDGTDELRLRRTLKRQRKTRAVQQTQFEMRLRGDHEKSKALITELIAARVQLAARKKHGTTPKRNRKKDVVVPNIPTPAADNDQLIVPLVEKAQVDIFPLEVWCNIFDKLKKPQDVLNCSKVSPAWKEGLKPKRTQYLFEQVLPILINNDVLDEKPEHHFQQLLELRQVCHLWRAGVDSYLDNNPCHYHLDEACTGPYFLDSFECHRAVYIYCFPFPDHICHGNISQPLSPSCGEHASFFHGRSIILADLSTTATETILFWNGARSLLSKVGTHIWHLEIKETRAEIETQLCSVLELVPNLKSLCVKYTRGRLPIFGIPSEHSALTYPPLSSTFPLLSKLEVLKIPSWRPFPPFIPTFLRNYTHIKKLGLINSGRGQHNPHLEENESNKLLEIFPRPNLEVFSAPHTKCERELAQLKNFIGSYPTLQSVSLRIPYSGEFSVGFQQILQVLEMREGVPLKSLSLKWPILLNTDFPRFQAVLRFPHLENLTLDAKHCYWLGGIDCILCLKSLRKLTVNGADLEGVSGPPGNIPRPTDEGEGNVINFLGFETRFYESNVWKLMPRLETVFLKDTWNPKNGLRGMFACCYDRDGYDKYWKIRAKHD